MLSGHLSMLCTNSGIPGMDTCTYQIVPAFVPCQTLCISSAASMGHWKKPKDRQLRPGRPDINQLCLGFKFGSMLPSICFMNSRTLGKFAVESDFLSLIMTIRSCQSVSFCSSA